MKERREERGEKGVVAAPPPHLRVRKVFSPRARDERLPPLPGAHRLRCDTPRGACLGAACEAARSLASEEERPGFFALFFAGPDGEGITP